MLSLQASKQAQKFLSKLPPKQQRQIAEKIQSLRVDPFPGDSKFLKGYAPFHRATIGEYRIVYKVEQDDQLLLVTIIGKRNDDQVYKLLRQRMSASGCGGESRFRTR